MRAGCRIVPGCGVAPGLTNILARLGADRLDTVESVRIYSYITHPLWTSPGIVVTRFDASSGSPARAVRPRRIRVLMELGFDCDEPFDVDGVAIAPRRFCRRLRRPARPRRG